MKRSVVWDRVRLLFDSFHHDQTDLSTEVHADLLSAVDWRCVMAASGDQTREVATGRRAKSRSSPSSTIPIVPSYPITIETTLALAAR